MKFSNANSGDKQRLISRHLAVAITGFALLVLVGIGVAQPASSLIGGDVAPAGAYRHQVSIVSQGFYNCSGSIIGDSWILTAAHCNDADQVTYGSSYRSGQRSVDVLRVVRHPDYDPNLLANDIALVEIDGVFPSDLPRLPIAEGAAQVAATRDGAPVTVLGWGTILDNGGSASESDLLLTGALTVIDNARCSAQGGVEVLPSVLCASSERTHVCNGDSGGGLIATIDGRDHLVGITSDSGSLDTCIGIARFTQPALYSAWVQQVTSQEATTTTTTSVVTTTSSAVSVLPRPGGPPVAVSGVAAEFYGFGVVVSWVDNSDDETGFAVERWDGGRQEFLWVESVEPGATSWWDSAPLEGLNYYRVVAFNEHGSTLSPHVRVDAGGSSPTTTTTSVVTTTSSAVSVLPRPGGPPVAVSGVAAEFYGFGVVVSWVDNSDDETGFAVERWDGGRQEFLWVESVEPGATSWWDSAPLEGLNYYRVVAFNEHGSTLSPHVRVDAGGSSPTTTTTSVVTTTSSAVSVLPRPGGPPVAVSGVAAEFYGFGVVVSWVDNSDDETGFAVERWDGGRQEFLWVESVEPGATSWWDSAPLEGLNYYRVVAFNEHGSTLSPHVRVDVRHTGGFWY